MARADLEHSAAAEHDANHAVRQNGSAIHADHRHGDRRFVVDAVHEIADTE
jgi:hypothetical protein